MMDKAKAYDEALERARKQRDDYQKELDKTDKNSQLAVILRAGISAIELAFPELTESEDEKIRKSLIEFLTDIKEISESGRSVWAVRKEDAEMCKSSIAYLEKQKEQKSDYTKEQVDKIRKDLYQSGYNDGYKHGQEKQKEQNTDKCQGCNNVNGCINCVNGDQWAHIEEQKPWKVGENAYFTIEQKSDWNEEDEKDIAHIIKILDDCYAYGRHDLSKTNHENLVNKLKSLYLFLKSTEEQEEPEYYQHFDPDC